MKKNYSQLFGQTLYLHLQADAIGLTSRPHCCPGRSRTGRRRRVRRAAPGSSRWTRRSRGTGGGSATRSPRRAGRLEPPGEVWCWRRLTGRSAAGTGGQPVVDQDRKSCNQAIAGIHNERATHENETVIKIRFTWLLTQYVPWRRWTTISSCSLPHLQPLSLHQPLEASDGPAGGIQDDLGQGGDLQGGVCPLRAVNQHRRPLPETSRTGHGHQRQADYAATNQAEGGSHSYYPDLSIHCAARQAVVRISLTWLCQPEASSLLSQRSILCDWSLQASTSFIRLSWRTLVLKNTNPRD